ncbi:hypothetical protein DSO57_1004854 [Entomophthora muscae]|uniref:Uncharacterized protein n=1 Tax=Entomophthora muscae TaxID=34485 RepID=A0ACC2RZ70_9FUNG|nr:hypothetical protein DSO57_1004854 [Entomophthora muscae]
MFVSLFVTLFYYLHILGFIDKACNGKAHSCSGSCSKVIIRVFSICLIYLFLNVPTYLLIMLEASQKTNGSQFLNLIISILISLNVIANPALILFAHSLIFDQLVSPFSTKLDPHTLLCFSLQFSWNKLLLTT